MDMPKILVDNRTDDALYVVLRPLNGRLRLILFPNPVRGGATIPPATAGSFDLDEGIADCIRDMKLSFELRNRSGKAVSLQVGREQDTGYPVFVIRDADEEE